MNIEFSRLRGLQWISFFSCIAYIINNSTNIPLFKLYNFPINIITIILVEQDVIHFGWFIILYVEILI